MNDKFQAKDIQRLLRIPKHRYEYLASKIGIRPEIDEVEGTGRTNLYSFKNVCQFGFVHHANLQGMSPKACREMLQVLDRIDPIYQLYDQGVHFQHFVLQFITVRDKQFFAIDHVAPLEPIKQGDQTILPEVFVLYTRQGEQMRTNEPGSLVSFSTWETAYEHNGQRYSQAQVARNMILVISQAYLTVNLATIKADVQGDRGV